MSFSFVNRFISYVPHMDCIVPSNTKTMDGEIENSLGCYICFLLSVYVPHNMVDLSTDKQVLYPVVERLNSGPIKCTL